MKSIKVDVLLAIVDSLSVIVSWSANEPGYLNESISGEAQVDALERLIEVANLCDDFGFNALSRQVKRDRATVEFGCTYSELSKIAENLKNRIQDEYEDFLFLWIEEIDLYQKDDLFGEQVGERFKGASFDIKEAGSCYAVGRYTACVYHLMRVAEFGLKSIGKRVGFSDDRAMWEPILGFINAELSRNREKMSDLFKGDIEFLSGIATHMHVVNLAWRRRVAHVERTYTQEEAKQIFDSTRNLMQHIAKKLSEVSEA